MVSQALGHTDVRMTKSIYAANVPNYNPRFGAALDALLQVPEGAPATPAEDELDRAIRELMPTLKEVSSKQGGAMH